MSLDIQQIEPHQITLLLDKASVGDGDAIDQLIPIIYPDLKLIASSMKRKHLNVSNTLNTTALVNEAWIKLNKYGVKAKSRKHFFCITAKAMRHILINSAEKKLSQKRHANLQTYDDHDFSTESDAQWIVQLDKIISSLEQSNQRLAEVFQLKYYLGFTEVEIAEILDITDRTVRRDWITVKKLIKEIMQ